LMDLWKRFLGPGEVRSIYNLEKVKGVVSIGKLGGGISQSRFVGGGGGFHQTTTYNRGGKSKPVLSKKKGTLGEVQDRGKFEWEEKQVEKSQETGWLVKQRFSVEKKGGKKI